MKRLCAIRRNSVKMLNPVSILDKIDHSQVSCYPTDKKMILGGFHNENR
jgi:hypothetical protein